MDMGYAEALGLVEVEVEVVDGEEIETGTDPRGVPGLDVWKLFDGTPYDVAVQKWNRWLEAREGQS